MLDLGVKSYTDTEHLNPILYSASHGLHHNIYSFVISSLQLGVTEMLIQCLGPTSVPAVRTILYVVGEYKIKMSLTQKEYYFMKWI